MDRRQELHAGRARDGLEALETFAQNRDINAHHSEFRSWRDRVQQSLGELFGPEHDYTLRFRTLRFWQERVSVGSGFHWTAGDQRQFDDGIVNARQILHDSLEELDVAPPTT